MKACIMCGGKGTRLHPLTFERPKPSIPILNKPLLSHLIEHLAKEGFTEIVVTLGYMGHMIEEQLGNGRMFGVHIDYVYEHKKLGTAGSVKNAENLLGNEPFIVLSGDHVLNLNLRDMFRYHEMNKSLITIGLLSIDDPREFGIADMDVNNKVHRFLEKPDSGEIFSNLASTGIYVCDPEIFNYIPENTQYDFAKDVFPKLMSMGNDIRGFLVYGEWTDVGNPAAYRAAQRWMLASLTGTSILGRFNTKNARISGPLKIDNNVMVGSNSSLVGPIVIGENTEIGDNVLIGPYTAIGSNCVIGNNARVLSSYIFNDVKIGQNTNVSGAVIDNSVRIGQNASLENGTVLGAKVTVGNGATIHSNVKIWPDLTIKESENVTRNMYNPEYSEE
ncbi:MAG: sugar phosphate nucleotidyltransferase [Methanohalobium sp.]|uniref:sugar phosphate nucleotidyltransferase n=1 Tax=Methanohalobium sp. TaxID=2837493 RepID=UPI00397914C5